jgi:predicted nucleic acid-binding protein
VLTIVDTSVWIDHFRHGNINLESHLVKGRVATHPFVLGEVSCGNLKNRAEIIELMASLPIAQMAEHHEVITMLEQRKMYGQGIGWIDMHLLAACLINQFALMTLDKPLQKIAHKIL